MVIDRRTLRVESGDELVQSRANTHLYSTNSRLEVSRQCSADVAEVTAYYNAASGLGTQDRMLLAGEEDINERAFGWVITGAYAGHVFELMSLGRLRFENNIANPYPQDKTVVIGTDDAVTGLISVYVGMKKSVGNPIEMAGLENGALYYIKLAGFTAELQTMATTPMRFSLVQVLYFFSS